MLDARTIRFDLRRALQRHACSRVGARCKVFSPKWAIGARRQATPLRPDRHRVPDHEPARTPSPSADSGRRIEFKRNPHYWARDLPVRRGFFNFDRVVYRYLPGQRRCRREAFKAGEFDLVQGVQRARLGAPAHGAEVGRRPDREGRRFRPAPVRACSRTSSICACRCSRISRVREALDLTYDFEMTINRYQPVHARRQHVQQLRLRGRGPAVGGRAEACSSRIRKELPPGGVRPGRTSRRATNGDPKLLRQQPAQGARPARRRPAGSSPPTAGCATPRASRSRSST